MRPAFVIEISSPCLMHEKMFSTKVLILEQKKIFHVSSNDQKVDGRVVSYMKRVPPIGAANAALTPAAAPAHANSRLVDSVLNFLKKLIGKYKVAIPIIAPMWASGPSLPTQSPAATESPSANILTKSVEYVKKFG